MRGVTPQLYRALSHVQLTLLVQSLRSHQKLNCCYFKEFLRVLKCNFLDKTLFIYTVYLTRLLQRSKNVFKSRKSILLPTIPTPSQLLHSVAPASLYLTSCHQTSFNISVLLNIAFYNGGKMACILCLTATKLLSVCSSITWWPSGIVILHELQPCSPKILFIYY